MPAPAKPPTKPPTPPRLVKSAGNQADFAEPAAALAALLGWAGDPDWVTNDIAVSDARSYITKVMHEHFQAAARGEPQPDYLAACKHLAVDNQDEQSAIDEALAAAFEAGKGVAVESHPTSTGAMSANIEAKLEIEG